MVGNIAGTDDKYMEMLINNGTLKLIVGVYHRTDNLNIRQTSLWVISNISRIEKALDNDIVELVVPLLNEELKKKHQ